MLSFRVSNATVLLALQGDFDNSTPAVGKTVNNMGRFWVVIHNRVTQDRKLREISAVSPL
jgi:hypothetical protein